MTLSSRSGSRGGEAMIKQIGGPTDASFHHGIRGLSARVVVHVQLMCESEMVLTGPGVCRYEPELYGMGSTHT
jgi:hypothetical protein